MIRAASKTRYTGDDSRSNDDGVGDITVPMTVSMMKPMTTSSPKPVVPTLYLPRTLISPIVLMKLIRSSSLFEMQ